MVHSKLKMKLLLLFCLLFISFNVANAAWVKVADGTGYVKDLYYDSSSNAVYAVTNDLGVLKSTDGGLTWVAKNTGIMITSSGYWHLDKIVGDGNGNIFLCAYAMFFRSSNGGNTWQQATATGYPPENGGVSSMAFDSYTNKLFVAANGSGIFRSSDLGESWEQINSGNGNIYSIYSGKSDSTGTTGMLLSGTYNNGIIKSTDGGNTWTPKGSVYWMTDIISGLSDWLFAISDDRIDRSKDYGESWTTVYNDPADTTYPDLAYDSESGYLYASTGSNDILRSLDGGDSWDKVTMTLMTGTYEGSRTVQVLPNQTLLVGSNYGIYRDGPIVDTNEPPATPVLTSPASGSTVYGNSFRLYWQKSTDPEGGNVTYRLQVAEDAGFTVNLREFEVNGDGSLLFAGVGVLLPLMFLLGWRRLIRRKPLMLMAVGILIATTLVVGCTPGNGPSAPIGDENTISYNVTGLDSGKTYYWRVIAVDDQNETSAPSETRSFITAGGPD